MSSDAFARYSRALHSVCREITRWCGALIAAMVVAVCLAVFSAPAQSATSHGSPSTHAPTAGVQGKLAAAGVMGKPAEGAGISKSAGSAGSSKPAGGAGSSAPATGAAGTKPPVVASTHLSTTTPGYWLASSHGGVGSYGGAPFSSSLGSLGIDAPVVALTPTHDGRGYWLAAADGGIFGFGDAGFYGSLAGHHLNAPVVAMAVTPSGHGYRLVGSDGGVYSFGDAGYAGSLSGHPLSAPVVALAPTHDGRGYWLVGADGGVFSFGDATFRGSASGNLPQGDGIVAMAVGPGATSSVGAGGNFTAPPPPPPRSVGTQQPGAVGYDISWPQCSGPFPAPSGLAIVGINDGTAFTGNPCFAQEAAWAGPNLSVYMNLNAPDPTNPSQFASGPAGACSPGAAACDSFNFGFNAAADALGRVHSAGYAPRNVWLDVETGNVWSPDTNLNDQVIAGAVTALRLVGATPGIYSTAYQYSEIAGAFNASAAEWLATGIGLSPPSPQCTTPSFTGGRVTLVQGGLGPFDGNYAC